MLLKYQKSKFECTFLTNSRSLLCSYLLFGNKNLNQNSSLFHGLILYHYITNACSQGMDKVSKNHSKQFLVNTKPITFDQEFNFIDTSNDPIRVKERNIN